MTKLFMTLLIVLPLQANKYSEAYLFKVISQGKVKEVKQWLHITGKSADIILEPTKNTPLHKAVIAENFAIIKVLVNHNVNVFIRNEAGKTALDIAKELRHTSKLSKENMKHIVDLLSIHKSCYEKCYCQHPN